MKQQPKFKRHVKEKKSAGMVSKPVRLFSEQEREEFLSRNDYIAFDYFVAGRMREKKHLSPKQQEILAKHEAVEALLQKDPEAMLRKAYQSIDEGVDLLLKLIHSRRLLHEEAGLKWDQAVNCLASRLRFMNEQLVRLAEVQAPEACSKLWFEAKQLTEAVVRLAGAYPEEFRSSAESSLTMPSLRARLPEFSCDAPAIAKAIHLAEKHPAPDISDNRSRMGALCHCLIARIVDEIESARRQKEDFERTAKFTKSAELIPAFYRPWLRRHLEACWKIPDLRGKAHDWWHGRVKDMVVAEFDRMKKNSTHNPGLWQELVRATDGGTEKEKWRVLEKNCRNKLNQIAGKNLLRA